MNWKRIKSLKTFEKYQKQFDNQTGFECRTAYEFMPNGDNGRTETYFQGERPIFRIQTANNHSFSAVYIPS